MQESVHLPEESLGIDEVRPLARRRRLPRRPPVIVFDPSRCTGCSACEMVCSTRNTAAVALAAASIKVLRTDENAMNFAILCLHCREPLCMEACPVHAIEKDPEGIVRINERFCVECGICTLACPEAAPLVEPETGHIHKCDLCDGDPLCVQHCPEGALRFVRGKALGWIRFLRWPVQLLSFMLLVMILIGTFCAFTAGVVSLPCPTGTLQNIAASGTLVWVGLGAALKSLLLH